jgi:uncharacterized membrane protein (DUF2068 family)
MHKPHLRYKNQTPKERDLTITIIAAFKFLKGILLIVIGVKLLTLLNRDVGDWAMDFVTRHGIDAENKFVHSILEKLDGVGNTQLMTMSVGSFVYSSLLMTEGVGLWLQKRWAEFLTVIATSLLVPLEVYEMYEKFTFVRLTILLVNLLIVFYLVTRLKDEKKVKLMVNSKPD